MSPTADTSSPDEEVGVAAATSLSPGAPAATYIMSPTSETSSSDDEVGIAAATGLSSHEQATT